MTPTLSALVLAAFSLAMSITAAFFGAADGSWEAATLFLPPAVACVVLATVGLSTDWRSEC